MNSPKFISLADGSVRVVGVVARATTALLIALATVSSHAQVAPPDISPTALAQIDALISEKATRTVIQQKLDSQLTAPRHMQPHGCV